MTENPSSQNIDIDARLKEAEVYYSMGLFQAAMGIYQQLLNGDEEISPEDQDAIRDKMSLLEFEIANEEQTDQQSLSSEDISSFKETFSGSESSDTILDSASAFKELGLFKEAVKEYEKLLDQDDHPVDDTVASMMECLLNTLSPDKATEEIIRVAALHNLDRTKLAAVKFKIGREMEKREFKEVALDLYKEARHLDPEHSEVGSRLENMTASLSTGSRYDYLLNKRLVTIENLQRANALAKQKRKSVEFILLESPDMTKEEVGKSLSLFFGCPFIDYDSELAVPVELLTNLKKAFLMQEIWVPLSWGKEGVEILVDNPRDITKTDGIRALIKAKKINFNVGIKEDIEKYIALFFSEQAKTDDTRESSFDDFDLGPDISFEEDEDLLEDEEFSEASGKVVRLVDRVLVEAYRSDATDIHVEPSPVTKATTIRTRMDGVCQEYMQVPNSLARGILSRLKIMAQLDISERRLPQDGKIKFRRKGIPPFELRIATLPTTGGFEDAVLRVLAQAGAMKLDDMGLTERNLRVLKQIIAKPYGLILVVGPTGSGKTTTLHASLGHINKPGIKIWTAEDPVEITQAGLRQVEARPKIGLDFARIMRAFLRADPDVIMIGEMRDHETAAIGVEASLTGHLVLSTLHTNSAPETVTRLLDMGLNPLNFSDAFLGVLAQRLVRRLCSKCREEYTPTREEFDEIVEDYGPESFEATGLTYSEDIRLYRPVGCSACSSSGYKGRLGVHELMEGSKTIKKMIKKEADTDELFHRAMKEGMTTLKQDGLLKVFQGLTDVSEVRRVCIT